MEIVKVVYDSNLKTSMQHINSGTKVQTAAPKDNNGDGSSFSPTDLLCSSLASCCLTIMAIKAEQNNIALKNVEISVSKFMGNNPRWVEKIELIFNVKENWTDKEKALMERSAKTCPVLLSLHPDMKKELRFNYL